MTSDLNAVALGADNSVRALTKSYNDFGQTIFSGLAQRPGNIVFSPYSAGVSFSMAMSGARGATQAEFLTAMRLMGPPSDIEIANGKLAELLASYAAERIDPEELRGSARLFGGDGKQDLGDRDAEAMAGQPVTELASANLLALVSPGGRELVSPEYRELLRTRYGAAIFENAKPATIDAWAAERTHGHVKRVANWDEEAPPEFVLLNAVHFNGRWAHPFKEDATIPLPFTKPAGERADVPTMRRAAVLPYLEGKGFKCVWLPYLTGALGMAIVLPDQGAAPNTIAPRLAAEGLPAVAERLLNSRWTKIELQLPRFAARVDASLKASAQTAGLRLPFERWRANFGRVTGRSDEDLLFVGDARQQASLEVTEAGTLASAVSIQLKYLAGRFRNDPIPFHVDRPFLFYVLDRNSGAILFQGRIDDPSDGLPLI